jgi:ribonuclease P protein component
VRSQRLLRRAEYQFCYRGGRRVHGRYATLHVLRNDCGHYRVGITVTRKVGKAVTRQLMKRRTREIFRRWPLREKLPGVDIIVHLRPDAASSNFSEYKSKLVSQLERVLQATGGTVAGGSTVR